ncbi:MAG: trypsin-like serine protease [Marinosulfonomonas sp.]|nr:trypsin-like serine protease [Marinosulfonomonas sp.]
MLFNVLIWVLAATAASGADSSALKTLTTGNDSRGWEAVGRLNMGGRSFCTGALIAPDLVLTAAHCLYNPQNGELVQAAEIEFLAGWRNGRANASSRIKRAIPHPDFKFAQGERFTRVANDLALLRLGRPIRKSSVKPFETAKRPAKGAQVGVVSYGRDRAESPALQEVCHVLARRSGALVLSCDVEFGSSGAPVFTTDEDGRARIVSVISAKSDVSGRSVALGTSLEKPLADLHAIMATKPDSTQGVKPTARVFTLAPATKGSGARFLRP